MSKQQQILFDNNHYSNGNVYDTSSINIIKHNNNNNNCNNHTGTKNNLEDFIYQLKQRNEEVDIDEDDGNELLLDHNGQNVADSCSKTMELYISNDNESTLSQSSSSTTASNVSTALKLANNNQNEQSSRDNLSIPYDTNALLVRLAKKEKDLILAAELGKALLDRNEELSRTNEQLNEEYTKNIELLEQEKYALRKKLNTIEIEYENRIHDLQVDLQATKENLTNHFELNRQHENENGRIITELTEQNRRLTTELKESSHRESALEKEIRSLKEHFNARRTNLTDHIGQLEGLRDEINLLSNRKRELENKISLLNEEKASISITLDESQYKIFSLEKQLYDAELVVQNQQKDLEELRKANIHYQNKLDSLMKTKCFDVNMQPISSLYNEIEIISNSSSDEIIHQPNYFGEEEIDIFANDHNGCHRCFKNKQEMNDLYNKLKLVFDDLNKRRQSDTIANQVHVSSNCNHDSGIQTNLSLIDEINMVVCDIQDLIKNMDFMQCISCQQFNLERNELDRLQKKCQQDKEDIIRLNSEIMELTSNATMQETELNALKERNKIIEEDSAANLNEQSQDEIVKRALKMRDETITRKNNVEIELAKVRIELMHVNSQLLETIQQKVELSQQLEQWQVDMEILIEEQLKSKLSIHENKSTSNGLNGNGHNMTKKDNLFGLIGLAKLIKYQRG